MGYLFLRIIAENGETGVEDFPAAGKDLGCCVTLTKPF